MPESPPASSRPNRPRRPARLVWWGLLPLLIPLLTGLFFSWHSLSDLDIWFHLRAGRDLLDGQGVSAVNRYSFTEPDHPWVNHEWMFQVLAAATAPGVDPSAQGQAAPVPTAWNLLRTALTLLLLLTLMAGDRGWDRLRGKEGAAAAAWAGVPILAGLLLLWPRLTIRPELFSYLFFVLLIRWSEQFYRISPPGPGEIPSTRAPGTWTAFFHPRSHSGRILLLVLIWAQFHGFSSLAPLILLFAGVLATFQARLFRGPGPAGHAAPGLPRSMVLILLAVVALTLTPNGWRGLVMPLRALGQFSQNQVDLRTVVSELVPLGDSPNSLGLTIALFHLSLVWGLVWMVATWGRVSLLRILVFVLAAVAAWTNQRSIGIYAVTFMLLHTGAGAHPWRFSLPFAKPRLRVPVAAIAGLAVTLLTAALLWPPLFQDDFYLREGVARRFGAGLTPAHYPVAAAADMTLQQSRRFFANIDAAAYLLANTTGRTFIDGRTEAYSPALWAKYLSIKSGGSKALAMLTERKVDAVCLATGGGAFDRLADRMLASGDWMLATAGEADLLFRPATRTPPGGNRNLLELAAARALTDAEHGPATRRADLCLAAGKLYGFAEDEPAMEAAFRRGLASKPSHPALNHNLGNLLLGKKRFREALPHFRTALATNGRLAGSAINAGVCLMRLGNPDKAARFFGRATAIDPQKFEAWVNLAVARQGSGDRQGAIRALEKALDLRPDDAGLRRRLGKLRNGPGK